jgi:3-oxoadipate enol-lactonase
MSAVPAQWIEVNGAVLRFALSGEGKVPVVLVHEAGGSIESWDEVLPLLEPHFKVLRYDQRGFGLSEKAATLSFEDILEDLRALLDRLDLGPCHLAGAAMGAAISLAFAARHPSRVRSVAVSSPTSCEPIPETFRAGLEARERAIREGGMRAVAEASLRGSYPETLRQANPERFERFRSRWLSNDPGSFIALNRLLPTDISAELGRITCPALVMGCARDPIRSPTDTRRISEKIPGARFTEVDSGHFLHLQSPEHWAALVLPFWETYQGA